MQDSAGGSIKLVALKLSAFAIVTVVFVEIILGVAAGSLAIVSDGVHATLDAVTMFVLFFATRASLKPPDEEHMYGHEKFESIGGLVGGLALTGSAVVIMYEAILKLLRSGTINFRLEYVGWIAIGYTFCVDFFRVRTMMEGRESQSSAMKVGFYHSIADLSSTLIALMGFGLAALGVNYGDAVASMILSALLSYLSVKLIWGSTMELSDSISKDVAERVRKEILCTEGVRKCENLRVRRAGDKTFVRATVQVPDYLNFEEAHDLTSKIEENIKKAIRNAEVTIHTEPLKAESSTEKLIEKLTLETDGVKGVHEIATAYAEGKLYVTLHIYVDSELTVEKADGIADMIEDRIQKRIAEVENVTVHIEPVSDKKWRGLLVREDEISKVIHEATKSAREVVRIKRIVTYVAGEKRYINIDCAFTSQTSLEDAHRIASDIEEKVQNHFEETIVTVHTESD
ncbi:MAG TPA: cation diffusion facilitator family transporter [Candidatus Acidoferrum sp.]|nr:cation diffusion facilitator family transporter [Candidatus Acidoferrum sp.]